ncbi:MAG: ATP-binding protein [Desulfurococcus sp.]|nr:ATP-binding protein [Desulfurococcus sp.]
MIEIGVIASGARVSYAPIVVFKGYEKHVKEEALVIVRDAKSERKYLGVLRGSAMLDPLLTHTQRSSIIERPELAGESLDLPYESAYVRILGLLRDGRLEPPVSPPTPRSIVYLVESPGEIGVDLGSGLYVGEHKYSGLLIPLDSRALSYHIAVVGTTGTGKSRLVKAIIDEVLAKTNWRVIVFDHTGMDYAPFYPGRVLNAEEIILDVESISDMLKLSVDVNVIDDYAPIAVTYYALCIANGNPGNCIERVNLKYLGIPDSREQSPRRTLTDKVAWDISEDILEDALLKTSENSSWSVDVFSRILAETASALGARDSTLLKLQLYTKLYGKTVINRLNRMRLRISDIIKKTWEERLVVVDLSSVETEIRRVIVKRVLEKLWEIVVDKHEPVDTLIVVDEAHNYACEKGCYPSNMLIEKTLREGRKWRIGVVLASQRIIDMGVDVRNNVNTVFFSRLQTPYDFDQLKGFVDLAGISMDSTALLETREFYVAGLGNPLKYPMLIRVREVS